MNTGNHCLYCIAEIHRRQDQTVKGHYKFQIAFMMELINRFLIDILIIILGMIIVLHEWSGTEIIYGRRDSCDRHGEIIGPSLNRRQDCDPVRISFLRNRQAVCELPDKVCIFIGAADSILCVVCMSRKLEIQVCDHFSLPVRMYTEYLIIRTCGPVIFGINDAPFFGCHGAEYQSVGRFITAFYQCTGDAEHHGDRCIIVLKSIEIGIIVGR